MWTSVALMVIPPRSVRCCSVSICSPMLMNRFASQEITVASFRGWGSAHAQGCQADLKGVIRAWTEVCAPHRQGSCRRGAVSPGAKGCSRGPGLPPSGVCAPGEEAATQDVPEEGASTFVPGSTLARSALCPRSRISTACSWTSGFYARLRLFPWPELNRHLYGHLPVPRL